MGPGDGVPRVEVNGGNPGKPALMTRVTGEAAAGEEPWDGTVHSREWIGPGDRQAVEGSGWEAGDGLLLVKLDGREGGTPPRLLGYTP
jgi:hypothetical protein